MQISLFNEQLYYKYDVQIAIKDTIKVMILISSYDFLVVSQY